MTVRLRPCGNPECRICVHNEPGKPPDSGHPANDDRLAIALMSVAIVFIIAVFLVVIAL